MCENTLWSYTSGYLALVLHSAEREGKRTMNYELVMVRREINVPFLTKMTDL
jgi:hypothetical protein